MPATAAQLRQPLRVSRRASHSESRTRTRGKVCANFGFTENVMTLAQFSVSSAMKLPKSAGELTPDELTEDTSDAAIGLTFALMKDLSAPDSAP